MTISEARPVAHHDAAPSAPPRLTRAALAERDGREHAPAPLRIVHLGLGAFHRAHQAWFTDRATDADSWGIAAFTGRSADAAEQLSPQDGLFSLIERSGDGDSISVVSSIVEARDGADLERFIELLAAPQTAIVTLTITEPGYRLTAAAQPDTSDITVVADLAWLAADACQREAAATGPTTSLGRLVAGLEARWRAASGPIAIVPCDNMPDNGSFVRSGVLAFARAVGESFASWVETSVSFVSTSVDRITPKTTPRDIETVAEASGWRDAAPVVTEPFADWVLCGEFPAGRPQWQTAGARFVDEIEPFEQRKLWLLNGAHSLLAYAGLRRGYATVAEAIADPECLGAVMKLWDEVERHLPAEALDIPQYRAALLERFRNERIEHRLAQISMEGVTKLRVRIAAVAVLERADGRPAAACAAAIAAWVSLLQSGVSLTDARHEEVQQALVSADAVVELIALLDGALAADTEFVAEIRSRL